MGCCSFFKGIFPTQGSILNFLHQQVYSLPLSHCKLDCRSICRLVTYISLPRFCVAQITVRVRLLKTPTSQAPEANTVSPQPFFLNRLKKNNAGQMQLLGVGLICLASSSHQSWTDNLTLSSQLFGASMKMYLCYPAFYVVFTRKLGMNCLFSHHWKSASSIYCFNSAVQYFSWIFFF